ncbi:RNase H domain-containing protein [Trichonephila clavipes]|nr:RNase H domain-containing protein [Trichonephila clavipes]
MVVVRIREELGGVYLVTLLGMMLKSASGISDHCSVFKLELIAISSDLDHALNSNKDSIWILTDSRSSIQYLKNWPKIMDSTGLDILSKLARVGQGNEAADQLVGVVGCNLPNLSSSILSHLKIHSLHRAEKNLTWRNPPAHH